MLILFVDITWTIICLIQNIELFLLFVPAGSKLLGIDIDNIINENVVTSKFPFYKTNDAVTKTVGLAFFEDVNIM